MPSFIRASYKCIRMYRSYVFWYVHVHWIISINEILNINDNTEYKPTEDDGYYIYKLSNNMKLLQYTVLHGIILKRNNDLVGKNHKLESFNWGNLPTEK